MSKHDIDIAHVTMDNGDYEEKPAGNVPLKYRGTAADARDMQVLGKEQVLRRNFKFLTMLGFTSTVICAWEIMLVISLFFLEDGGRPTIFWGMIIGPIGMSFVYMSIAELASMSPTAGGQYHWVSQFAPPSAQKFLSYCVGWLLAIGWQVYLAGICFMLGGLCQGLVALNVDGYVYHRYHATLFALAAIVVCVGFNTLLTRILPLLEGLILILHIGGMFAIIIPLWVMGPRASPREALLNFTDTAGWDNLGLSSIIGLITVMGLLIGYDCAVHMAEEVEDASRVIPKVITWTVLPNGLMCFIVGVTYIFTLGNLEDVVFSPYGQPVISVFYNATGSKVGASLMTGIIIVMLSGSCVSENATASRQLWSFARDRGLPFSTWLSHVSPRWNIPLRAVIVSMIISALLSLVNIGSSAALNAIDSLGANSIAFSYTITIGCLIWQRVTGKTLPPRRWSLGRWGLTVNIIGVLFIMPIWFFNFWPLTVPVTAENMNWSSTMFFGVLIIALIYYFVKARHEYTGPVMQMRHLD